MRLGQTQLSTLSSTARTPDYERANISPGIVHLGIGAFHRAHMAVYVDRILAKEPAWGIIGASLRRPDTKMALEPQDYLYCVATRGVDGTNCQVVGSIVEIIDASVDVSALLARMAAPSIRIVSLTVTEKGYCHEPATGSLNKEHPDIARDLLNLDAPHSVPGIIVAALMRRRDAGMTGFTVLSCDNLQGNGHVAKRVVTEFAEIVDPALARWIATHVRFPNTMVDRIVPSTTDRDLGEITSLLGAEDAWPVVTEPFSQWVVEDDFIAGRPQWEHAGVQMVADVLPYEHMKLRLLNGSHSAMAYLGLLAGHEFVAEAIADTGIQTLLRRMMRQEIAPTLNVPNIDLPGYCDQLLARFSNPALYHGLKQIAADGTQKLPQRILAPLRERMAGGETIDCLTLTAAAWIAFLADRSSAGAETIQDPLGERLVHAVSDAGRSPRLLTDAILGIEEVFGNDLPTSSLFRHAVEAHLDRILSQGAGIAIEAAISNR